MKGNFSTFIIFLGLLLLTVLHCSYSAPSYKEEYFDQVIDHFNFKSLGNQTFKQRYLIQDTWWQKGSGPIFFYTGNEGDIVDFWTATGLVHEIAPGFNALVIFAEHRYYGKSLPFGNSSFQGSNVGYLTIDQALADYAMLLTTLKQQLNAPDVPVIAFGGSYGGMLSAYMRFKYPNVITGALAASAPIFMLDPNYDRSFFFSLVTQDFTEASTECVSKIKQGFSTMDTLSKQGKTGLGKLSSIFKLCAPLTANGNGFPHLLGWIRNAFTYLAMLDYPYPTDFIGMKLPANPVNAACKIISATTDPVEGLAAVSEMYYGGGGKCNDIFAEFIECADPTGCGVGPNAMAWDYQACTEITLPSGSNNVTDMFPVLPFTPEIRRDYCMKRWGVTPRDVWAGTEFWGQRINSSSNIIFSNGNLDPWRGGGVSESLSESLVAIPVEGGAHHLDLRASNKLDPPGVTQARKLEKALIQLWITSL